MKKKLKTYSQEELMLMYGFKKYWLSENEQQLIKEYRTENEWDYHAKEEKKKENQTTAIQKEV